MLLLHGHSPASRRPCQAPASQQGPVMEQVLPQLAVNGPRVGIILHRIAQHSTG
jgi:hypothetical protein